MQLTQPSTWVRRTELTIAAVLGLLTLTSTPAGASAPHAFNPLAGCITTPISGSLLCPPGAPTIVSATPAGLGAFAVSSNGTVYPGGGGLNNVPLNAPIVSITVDPLSPLMSYWLLGADGGVFALAGAPFFGSMGGKSLNAPMVGIAPTPSGHGYWLVAADGGVFAFGDAGFFGSMGGHVLNAPIVGIVGTPSGMGYWLVAKDGGVFSFGDAVFFGSMAGQPLNAPIVAINGSPGGSGYWLFGQDGGVFAFGNAPFAGSFLGASGLVVSGWNVEQPGPLPGGGFDEYCVATSSGQLYCFPT